MWFSEVVRLLGILALPPSPSPPLVFIRLKGSSEETSTDGWAWNLLDRWGYLGTHTLIPGCVCVCVLLET